MLWGALTTWLLPIFDRASKSIPNGTVAGVTIVVAPVILIILVFVLSVFYSLGTTQSSRKTVETQIARAHTTFTRNVTGTPNLHAVTSVAG